MNSTDSLRGHPLQILRHIYKQLALLLLVLLRGLLRALTGDFLAWVQGSWLDWLIVCVIVGSGVLQWWFTTYSYDTQGVTLSRGFFFPTTTFLPQKRILSYLVLRPLLLRPFGVVQLRLDTAGGSFRHADFNLLLSRKVAGQLCDTLQKKPTGKRVTFRSHLLYVMALSLITSNSFAGIVLITTMVSQSGRVIGEELGKRVYGAFRQISAALAFGLPPAAAWLALVLFAGWLVTFFANVLRYQNLTVSRRGACLQIQGGLLTVREYTLPPDAISYVDIRQTVVTKALGLYSVFVHAIGYGKSDKDVSVVIPAISQKDLYHSVQKLTPHFFHSYRTLQPNFGAILRFVTDPLYPCCLIPLITLLLQHIYPTWKDFLLFLGAMSMLPALWFLAVRLLDFVSSGISKSKGCYTLRYSKGFYLHTVILPQHKLVKVTTRQSIIQKMDNKCDVFVYSYCEGVSKHRLRNLDKTQVLALFSDLPPSPQRSIH